MIHLILNDDSTIKNALHESCGVPEEPHVDVEDAMWAAVAGYGPDKVRFVNGELVVDAAAAAASANARVKANIARIEAAQGRALREAALGDPSRLKMIEDQIVALRAQLSKE